MIVSASLRIQSDDGETVLEESRRRTVMVELADDAEAKDAFAEILRDHGELVDQVQAAFAAQAARWMDLIVRD